MKVQYFNSLKKLPHLSDEEKEQLSRVTEKFPFRANDYYLNLINWDDPNDPIRRIIIPGMDELEHWGALDASNEARYTVAPGLEHKYSDTALFLLSDVCGSFCRFCFRKRLFMHLKNELVKDYTTAIEYIKNHPEITNVLLTGGEPLLLSTRKLTRIIKALREIDHVGIIRIGTKMPVFNPYRILDDPELVDMINTYSTKEKRIYMMLQINHPNEITDVAMDGIERLIDAGAILMNQTPLICGINDEPAVLSELFRKLSFIGVAPYYVFQCRPTLGNKTFAIPIVEGFSMYEKARKHISGLAKRSRYVMSHVTGKIEVLGYSDDNIFLRYLRAYDPENQSRFLIARRDDTAYWLDDLEEVVPALTLPMYS